MPHIRETDENLASTPERLYTEKYPPHFEVGPERGVGRHATGGPFWIHCTRLLERIELEIKWSKHLNNK